MSRPTTSLQQVRDRPGCQAVGRASKSNSTSSIRAGMPITCIDVFTDAYGKVCLQVKSSGESRAFLMLSRQGAVDLVTAIARQLPDVTIATADELLATIGDAKRRSDEDARAMVDAVLQRRHDPIGD